MSTPMDKTECESRSCANAVERAHTNSLDANDQLIQTRPHVRNTIASRKRQVVMRKGKSTIPSRDELHRGWRRRYRPLLLITKPWLFNGSKVFTLRYISFCFLSWEAKPWIAISIIVFSRRGCSSCSGGLPELILVFKILHSSGFSFKAVLTL